nr:uncharacterized protein LOC105706824 [Aotus nancymaae]
MGLFLSYDCVKPRQNLEGKHTTQCAMTEVSCSSLSSTLGPSQGYGLHQGVSGQPLPRLCGVLLSSAEKVTLSSFYPNQPLPATAPRPWVFYGLLTSLKQSMSLPRQGQLGRGRDRKFVKLDSPRICTERLDSESPSPWAAGSQEPSSSRAAQDSAASGLALLRLQSLRKLCLSPRGWTVAGGVLEDRCGEQQGRKQEPGV